MLPDLHAMQQGKNSPININQFVVKLINFNNNSTVLPLINNSTLTLLQMLRGTVVVFYNRENRKQNYTTEAIIMSAQS